MSLRGNCEQAVNTARQIHQVLENSPKELSEEEQKWMMNLEEAAATNCDDVTTDEQMHHLNDLVQKPGKGQKWVP